MFARDSIKILLIVVAASTTRAFSLWIGRAEFTGWLNHSYYYFVQVRGLLEQGSLPYADMPLLFHFYAVVARVLMAVGIEADTTVVASTRLVMCLVPSLIPLPMYWIVRTINRGESLSSSQWVLVLISGFLPLTVSYMPEFLQKNTLGLLLLACLILATQQLLGGAGRRAVGALVGLWILIVLTHFGTFGAASLWVVAGLLAWFLVKRTSRGPLVAAAVLFLSLGLAVALVWIVDAQRFGRLFAYLGRSLEGSLIAVLLTDRSSLGRALPSLTLILGIYGLLYLVYRVFTRRNQSLSDSEHVFFLANTLFVALLLAPVLDEQLMGRLASFAVLPGLVLLVFFERYGFERRRLATLTVALAALGLGLLTVGELVSSRIHNRGHQQVRQDLAQLESAGVFGVRDLVVSPTGGEHVSNWFFRVKAGVITSLSLEDFTLYDRVFVLNPVQGTLDLEGVYGPAGLDGGGSVLPDAAQHPPARRRAGGVRVRVRPCLRAPVATC